MQFPQIHMNGTSPETLRDQYHQAWSMVKDALEYMVEHVETHGRDYYPISSDAASVAMAEHRERIRKLRQVEDELSLLVHHCAQRCKVINHS